LKSDISQPPTTASGSKQSLTSAKPVDYEPA
jgi:hypothetical protein